MNKHDCQKELTKNYRGGLAYTGMIEQVRELRKHQTEAEAIFWQLVRNKKFQGLKFRRQHQIGDYIVDFYCHKLRLVIELDGDLHKSKGQIWHDKRKDKYLETMGCHIIRIENRTFLKVPERLFEKIETYKSK